MAMAQAQDSPLNGDGAGAGLTSGVESRAPGKTILVGEHGVVYGGSAVAAAINLYTTVSIRPGVDDGCVVLDLPQLGLALKLPLQMIEKIVVTPGRLLEPKPKQVPSYSESEWPDLGAFLEQQLPSDAVKGAFGSVTVFLFLYTLILGLQPVTVRVTSELPVGAGLGSSAAYCVALSAALLAYAGVVDLPQANGKTWVEVDEKNGDLVNRWAFEGERIIHGRPSGIDNTVSSFGSVVKFRKGQITRLHTQMPLRMLLTNTRVGRNTKAVLARVGGLALLHPEPMGAMFKVMDVIAENVVTILLTPPENSEKKGEDLIVLSEESGPHSFFRTEQEGKLQDLVMMSRGVLLGIDVSHPSIESICQVTASYKLQSKLTGAGGGGYVLTLLPHKLSPTLVELVKVDLEAKGFSCFEAVIGGNGVQVRRRTLS